MYKLYLLIGINFFLFSCEKKVDYQVKTTYIYSNTTDYNINMRVFSVGQKLKEYFILSKDSISFELTGEGGVGPFQYGSYDTLVGDSITLIFNNEKIISYIKDYDSIFNENSYVKHKINDKNYEMFYEFSNSDFENATNL